MSLCAKEFCQEAYEDWKRLETKYYADKNDVRVKDKVKDIDTPMAEDLAMFEKDKAAMKHNIARVSEQLITKWHIQVFPHIYQEDH